MPHPAPTSPWTLVKRPDPEEAALIAASAHLIRRFTAAEANAYIAERNERNAWRLKARAVRGARHKNRKRAHAHPTPRTASARDG